MRIRTHLLNTVAIAAAIALPLSVAHAAGKKPSQVTISVGNPGTPWSVVGATISQIMAKNGVKSNTELGGGLSNVVTVSNGRTNTGFTMAAVLPMAREGAKPFPKKIGNVRAIGSFMTNATHVMVRSDAGVNNFPDLKGKAFATQPVGNVTTLAFQILIGAYGLKESDLKISRGGQNFGANQLKDRKVVGFTATTGYPAAAFLDAAQTINVKLLGISDDALKKVQKVNSGFVRHQLPANLYKGQTKPVPTMATQSMLITNTNVTDDEAYFITKTIVENLNTIKKVHASVRHLTPKFMARPPAVELHPGAAKYYKEKGYLN
ncbi:MAG: TAXI family TRAP transporter solute-binding subunit [Alphaproteobacteria bacterium]|nr:TAXI family TRAP transporter solute-binding subunit [Alphaproteobacteria bacterium]